MTEWKYPEAVVETDWLAKHLEDGDIRIFDCTTYLRYTDDDPSQPYIVESGRAAGTLTFNDNVGHFTDMGVRFVMTSAAPWIDAGAAAFRSAAGIS